MLVRTPLLILMIFIVPFSSPASGADGCERFQQKVEQLRKKRRSGGSASQMDRWRDKQRQYRNRYHACRRGGVGPAVQSASGRVTLHDDPDYEKPRETESSDGRINKLLKTCNYWVAYYNREPTDAHQSYRDTACRAFREAERRGFRPPEKLLSHERSLSECIKPGNRVDNDVQACLEGRVEPTWRQADAVRE